MRKASLTVLAVAAMLLAAIPMQHVSAYSVRLSYMSANPGVIDFERPGHCRDRDAALHTFMPATEAFNNLAVQTLNNNQGRRAPMGGFSRKAICLDKLCNWQYYKGLYEMNEITFYSGVHYKGVAKVEAVPGFYNNWASGFPTDWANISYWGLRQVALHADGQWRNEEVVTYYTDWVCEAYEYQKSDHVFFPTWINGDPIIPTTSAQTRYTHCGFEISMDSEGRLLDVQCDNPMAWWIGLVIAVGGLIAVVLLIILVWCCCCFRDRKEEEKEHHHKLATTRDNPSAIPNQSELGMSRGSSMRYAGGDDDEDERSFSRAHSDV